MSDKRWTTLRPKGWLFVTPEAGGRVIERETAQCRHCGGIWVIQPGSGRLRGYCTLCKGMTCGPACSSSCIPTEVLLESIEKGKDPAAVRPVAASVTHAPPPAAPLPGDRVSPGGVILGG